MSSSGSASSAAAATRRRTSTRASASPCSNPPETGAAIGELAEGRRDRRARRLLRRRRGCGPGDALATSASPRSTRTTASCSSAPDVDCVVVAMHPRLQPARRDRDCLEAGRARLRREAAGRDARGLPGDAGRGRARRPPRHGRVHEALLGALPAGARDRRHGRLRPARPPTRRASRSASTRRAPSTTS